MNASCRGYRRALLLASPSTPDDPHPDGCDACRHFLQWEELTAGIIRANRPDWRAPIHLRERVAAALEQERRRTAPWPLRSRRLAIGAFAAVMVGALVLLVARPEPSNTARAREAVELLVEDHLEFARRGPERLKIASASASEIEAYFEEHLGFSPRLPRLVGARLLGGRRCSLGGNPAALVFYGQGGSDGATGSISLFVFEPRGAAFRGGMEASHRGVGVVLWEERGLVYALAGPRDAPELRRLIE
jgi:anti-sigma factor RsiW